jgi:hypothetical protein
MSAFRPNAPFVNYFFLLAPDPDSGANVPNAGGTLTFYDDTARSSLLATYSDVSDPNNPVVNPNPLTLGADGSAPLIYLQDKLYYIVEEDVNGAVIRTYEHFYSPYDSGSGGDGGGFNNFIPDGQFDYPIDFGKSGNKPGQIYQTTTAVAWTWQFLQDANTTTQNYVTFDSIANEIIQGSPVNQIVVTSQNVQSGEATKDLRVIIGNVNFSQNTALTLYFLAYSQLGGAPIVGVNIEKYYGLNGSPTEIENITSFTLNGTRTPYQTSFTPSSNSGKTIGPGSTLALRFQVAIGQLCQVAMTNFLVKTAITGETVTYPEEGDALTAAKVLGDAASYQLSTTGLVNNFQRLIYGGVSNIITVSDTGKLFLALKTASFPDAVRCTGTSYKISDYNSNNISYSRLYSGQPGSIGIAFGSAGSLIISSAANVVTFTIGEGGQEHSPYTNGTTGAAITATQTVPGQRYGVSCAITPGTPNEVTITWLEKFTAAGPPFVSANDLAISGPNTPWGNLYLVEYAPYGNIGNMWAINITDGSGTPHWGPRNAGLLTVTDVTIGSPSDNAVSTVKFNIAASPDYISAIDAPSGTICGTYNGFLEWATPTSNARARPNINTASGPGDGWDQSSIAPGVSCTFSVDGNAGQIFAGAETATVAINSSDSPEQIAQKFIATVDNPFVDIFTVNGVPAASTYILFSDTTTDYYGWFKVDGTGTDPMVADRTGVEIDISATDSTTQIATKIVTACDSLALNYNVPDETNADHVPSVVPPDCLTGYFITL